MSRVSVGFSPSDYNLPHQEWRKGQLEAIEWCFDSNNIGVVESCTGSGKTAYAAAVASQKSVIALCRTKNLQASNYGGVYDFDVLFGKANYRCVHPDAPSHATCGDCKFGDNMYKCPVVGSCPYMVQKALCKASPKVSLNYHYWLVARWCKENPPSTIFLDEAHELHQIVTDFAGCTITEKDRLDWDLAQFPELRPTSGGGLLVKVVDPLPTALGWLQDAKAVLGRHWLRLKSADSGTELKQRRRCERLGRKIRATLDALQTCPEDWYISSGRQAQRFGKERRPAFVCKPLTSRWHAPGYFGFNSGQRSILMSATVGDPQTFANELGIKEYDFMAVPNQYPPESRQIYVLDVPSMGAKAKDSAFNEQADKIARAILDCPNDWPGIVHVTRKREAALLADRLARRGLQDRVWAFPGSDGTYTPTDKQVAQWEARKRKVPNSIGVAFSLWTGYDGLVERINVVAKTPWPLWGSPGSFEGSWRAYDMSRYRWQAGCTLSQGLGRTRRGRPEDYDLNGGFEGFVAIADASWLRLKKYLSSDVLDSVVEL